MTQRTEFPKGIIAPDYRLVGADAASDADHVG
jgi:hypothetical protein